MANLPDKFEAKKGDYFWLYPEPLTRVTDPNHPLYDKRVELPFDEAWVIAAMNGGMPDPLFVKREGDQLLIVEGRQRHSAAVEANKRLKKAGKELIRVPVITTRGEESDLLGLMISSNMLRLANTIADNADLANRYMKTGKTKKETAIRFGVSETAIDNWINYLELSPTLKKEVDSGVLTGTAALKLKDLSAEDQKSKIKELKDSGVKITVEKARSIAAGKPAGVKRPSRNTIEKLKKCPEIPGEFIAFIEYISGGATREDTEAVLPWMKMPEKPAKVAKTKVKSDEGSGNKKVRKKKKGK